MVCVTLPKISAWGLTADATRFFFGGNHRSRSLVLSDGADHAESQIKPPDELLDWTYCIQVPHALFEKEKQSKNPFNEVNFGLSFKLTRRDI